MNNYKSPIVNPSAIACCVCGFEGDRAYFRLPDSAREFLPTQYICQNCVEKPVQNYFTRNSERVVGNTDKLPTFGIELEVVRRSPEVLSLEGVGWIPTEDPSIPNGVEMKSPVYSSLQDAEPILEYISEHIVGDVQSGTHIHVGIDRRRLFDLADYWVKIWSPLVLHMLINRKETESIWGRTFNWFAQLGCIGRNRYAAFSCNTHTQCTVEYRLPVFRSAEQYSRIIDFARKATQILANEPLKDCADARNIAEKICALYSEIFEIIISDRIPNQEMLVGVTPRNRQVFVYPSADHEKWDIAHTDGITTIRFRVFYPSFHEACVRALDFVEHLEGKIHEEILARINLPFSSK